MKSHTLALAACALLAGGAAAWECSDLHADCPHWKQNMGGDCNGQDKEYMTINCPQTCGFCAEAEARWEKEEAERRKNPTYEPEDSSVIILDGDTIEDFVEQEGAEAILLIEFFAPWCGHCQHVAPSYREAANELEELSESGKIPMPVRLAKYDDGDAANQHYRAADVSKWNFTSYPSMYLAGGGDPPRFSKPGEKKDHYWGGHEVEEIVHHMTQLSNGKNQTEARIEYHKVEKGMKPGFYKPGGKHETTHIQELDPENFLETVLRDDAMWIVEYYSDKCPICNSLAPELTKAAEKAQAEHPGELKFGAINSRVWEELSGPFEILSYPWVTSFYKGKKVEDMAGMGGWESFYNWAKEKHKLWSPGQADKNAEIPPVPEDKKDEL
jgi:thiol-disulfide isomerase/thioredoxin